MAEFIDGEAPVLSVTQPVSGTVVESLFSVSGTASDAVGLKSVSWAWNGVLMGEFNQTAGGGFSVANLNLAIGTNRIEITATDAAGNATSVSREVVWSPIRTLIAGSATEVQEGQRMTFPLSLVSSGDVGGLTFKLNYNSACLTAPKVEWSALVGQSVNSINTAVNGEILGAFSLPGAALPTGTLPDVIYLDPMFPPRTQSALMKKELRALARLVGADIGDGAHRLLRAAFATGCRRVVVKRPRKAPDLLIPGWPPPGARFEGRAARFDVYFPAGVGAT